MSYTKSGSDPSRFLCCVMESYKIINSSYMINI